MNTTHKTPTIDYWAIFNELLKSVREPNDPMVLQVKLSPNQVVSQFRTIGFSAARQAGKTDFVAELLKKDDNAVAVVVNRNFYLELLERCNILDVVNAANRIFTAADIANYPNVGRAKLATIEEISFIAVDGSEYVYRRLYRETLLSFFSDLGDYILVEVN